MDDGRCVYCEASSVTDFCAHCGGKKPESEEEWIITRYFKRGYPYSTIIAFLNHQHGIKMSLRTLKSRLKEYGLKRKKVMTVELADKLSSAIQKELQGPSRNTGYRGMWSRLSLFHGISLSRDAVMNRLRELDPSGTANRKSCKLHRRTYTNDGPNSCWHLDGYDKLKHYGFPIHGCVDGYSRRIMWLRTIHSNNDPNVIARLFVNCLQDVGGCPTRVRNDCGSENVALAAIQCYLRRNGNDVYSGEKAHIYGSSHSNQRIEGWWSFYRRCRSSDIINHFKDMVDNDDFNPGDPLHIACVRYCFAELIQEDLDRLTEYWNSHYIRKSRFETVPGRPDELYFLPFKSGGTDTIKQYDENDLHEIECHVEDNAPVVDEMEEVMYEYFAHLARQLGLSKTTNWQVATNTCRILLSHA